MRKAKKQVHARVKLNPQNPNENRKLPAAEHGVFFDPLYVQNRYRPELIIVEKEYHSGAKYIRQIEPQDGKTIDFTYVNSRGHIFYQRYRPEPRIQVYHNRETGKTVTTWKQSGIWLEQPTS